MQAQTQISDFFPSRKPGERQWVVRASKGRFVNHFLHYGLVAIGHLDGLNADRFASPREVRSEDMKAALRKPGENGVMPSRAAVTNQANQALSFIHEIKPGDRLLTLDDHQVAIGKVTGDPYFSSEALSIPGREPHRPSLMRYKTRREVNWEFRFPRSNLPLNVEHSFRAHQTVFNADRHWEYLYHLVYPIFTDGDHLYFSNMIRQENDIDSFSVGRLLRFYSDLEVALRCFEFDEPVAFAELERRFRASLYSHELICRAQFFSKGPVWLKQPIQWIKDYRKTVIALLAFQALFGGTFGFIESPGLITPTMREAAWQVILEIVQRNDMADVLDKLLLDAPRYERPAEALEVASDNIV